MPQIINVIAKKQAKLKTNIMPRQISKLYKSKFKRVTWIRSLVKRLSR